MNARQPRSFRPWQDHEQEATEIRCYELALVPGLLQTEAYAMALLGDPERLTARMERQGILDRAKVTVVIAERVLREPIGGPDVMAEQLESLAASPAVVHVLSATAVVAGSHDGGFALAVVDGGWCGYVDTPARGFVLTEESVTSGLRERWERLIAESLPTALSQAMILKEAERWRTDMG